MDELSPSGMTHLDETVLSRIEREHSAGLTSVEILDVFASYGLRLSEATLRKYVQLGLLPRSVRVGKKGKHQGSKGVYPVSVIRQILQIKRMMADSYTIEQIQKEFLFMRSDLEQLERTLGSIFKKLDTVLKTQKKDVTTQVMTREVGDARSLSKELLQRLHAIENRITSKAQVERVIAS
jgi:BMFP domain-containing protein YqiC